MLEKTRLLAGNEEGDESLLWEEHNSGFLAKFGRIFTGCWPQIPRISEADGNFGAELELLAETTDKAESHVNAGSRVLSKLKAGEKLEKLRKLMKKHGISVYIVPSEDEHHSEEPALADKRMEFISGFTGSAGVCVITLDNAKFLSGEAILSTDGRYFLQARKQLDQRYWKLLEQGSSNGPLWQTFALERASESRFSPVISCDPRLISLSVGQFFEKAEQAEHGLYNWTPKFVPLQSVNLVDVVWGSEKPARSLEPIYHLPLRYSGEEAAHKIERIRAQLKQRNGTHLVVASLDDIAWLLNLRSDSDFLFTPVFFSYVVVSLKSITLYINRTKVDQGKPDLREHLAQIPGLQVEEYSAFYSELSKLGHSTSTRFVFPDKAVSSYALLASISTSCSREAQFESLIANDKIVKNKTELYNAKLVQHKDSLAFVIFTYWLHYKLTIECVKVSEYEAACKIDSIRAKFPNYKGPSYDTISSTGANAAVIHYAPTKDENSVIDPSKIYLLDAGAQYLEGTTDITRTYLFGHLERIKEYQMYYTLVLKGHLAIATAKFPSNSTSTGTILDAYAREPLWNKGLDYNHGTGHGIASFGNVHEGPLYILSTVDGPNSTVMFREGQILTDEPGYYKENEFGFRIESELEIKTCDEKFGKTRSNRNFLSFDYLTKVPFCRKLIDKKFLGPEEIDWINSYHKMVFQSLGPSLKQLGYHSVYSWLRSETKAI